MSSVSSGVASTATRSARLGWLDAVRGLGAILVAFSHVSYLTLGGVREAATGVLDIGKYGVLIFFLVSGYVIPMSLGRHADLRRFWIGRIFRIFPALLASVVLMAATIAVGATQLAEPLRAEPATAVLAHISMLPELLGLPGLITVYWTLSYEMTFYLLVAGLFALGLRRHAYWSAPVLALIALVIGPQLPVALVTPNSAARAAVSALVLLLLVGVVAASCTRRLVLTTVAGVLSLAALALPLLNSGAGPLTVQHTAWWGPLLLAIMFAGTVIYQLDTGLISRRRGAAILVGTCAAIVSTMWLHRPAGPVNATDFGTLLATVLTFGAAYALRHRRFPRSLAWLGAVSYSVYLLHQPMHFLLRLALQDVLPDLQQQSIGLQLLVAAFYFATVLGVSWLSYRYIEQPGQALGRQLLNRWPIPATPPLPRQRTGATQDDRRSALR